MKDKQQTTNTNFLLSLGFILTWTWMVYHLNSFQSSQSLLTQSLIINLKILVSLIIFMNFIVQILKSLNRIQQFQKNQTQIEFIMDGLNVIAFTLFFVLSLIILKLGSFSYVGPFLMCLFCHVVHSIYEIILKWKLRFPKKSPNIFEVQQKQKLFFSNKFIRYSRITINVLICFSLFIILVRSQDILPSFNQILTELKLTPILLILALSYFLQQVCNMSQKLVEQAKSKQIIQIISDILKIFNLIIYMEILHKLNSQKYSNNTIILIAFLGLYTIIRLIGKVQKWEKGEWKYKIVQIQRPHNDLEQNNQLLID